MNIGSLGKIYQHGETIVRQGELGDCMYVIQDGQVEVVSSMGGREVPRLRVFREAGWIRRLNRFRGGGR